MTARMVCKSLRRKHNRCRVILCSELSAAQSHVWLPRVSGARPAVGGRRLRGSVTRGHDQDAQARAPSTSQAHYTREPSWPMHQRSVQMPAALMQGSRRPLGLDPRFRLVICPEAHDAASPGEPRAHDLAARCDGGVGTQVACTICADGQGTVSTPSGLPVAGTSDGRTAALRTASAVHRYRKRQQLRSARGYRQNRRAHA